MPKRKRNPFTNKKQGNYYTSEKRLRTPEQFKFTVTCDTCRDTGLIEIARTVSGSESTAYACPICNFGKVLVRLDIAYFPEGRTSRTTRLTRTERSYVIKMFQRKENHVPPEVKAIPFEQMQDQAVRIHLNNTEYEKIVTQKGRAPIADPFDFCFTTKTSSFKNNTDTLAPLEFFEQLITTVKEK